MSPVPATLGLPLAELVAVPPVDILPNTESKQRIMGNVCRLTYHKIQNQRENYGSIQRFLLKKKNVYRLTYYKIQNQKRELWVYERFSQREGCLPIQNGRRWF